MKAAVIVLMKLTSASMSFHRSTQDKGSLYNPALLLDLQMTLFSFSLQIHGKSPATRCIIRDLQQLCVCLRYLPHKQNAFL